jgi:hypothetical protein
LRTLQLLLLLTFVSCETPVSQGGEVTIAQTKDQSQAEETALAFINNYVLFATAIIRTKDSKNGFPNNQILRKISRQNSKECLQKRKDKIQNWDSALTPFLTLKITHIKDLN